MARYIDAEKFAERIKASPIFPNMGQDGYFLREFVLDLIDRQVADVVPKSEVEKAKAEVAREIFDEIEKEIDLGLSVISKILNAKGGRCNGKTILISKYDVYIEAKKHLAELKKKYTGDQT